MKNYALDWKHYVNFKEISYNDFLLKFHDLKNSKYIYYMEKIDGMLGALVYIRNNDIFFQTTTGAKIKDDLPVLNEYKYFLSKNKDIKEAIFLGELVAVKHNTILPFNQSQSIIKTSYIQENKPLIHHYLYDVWSINGKRFSFPESIDFIKRTIDERQLLYIHIPKTSYGVLDNFRYLYSKSVGEIPGIEGIVIRSSEKNYKVKPFSSFDLVVIGVGNVSMKTWDRNKVSYLVVAFVDNDGIFRTSSKVGVGFSEKERSNLFEYAQKNKVQEMNGEIFIKPKLIIEAQWRRYLLRKMPSYKFKNGKYEYVGNLLSATMHMPSFLRFREDKKINDYDLRLDQIPDYKE